MTGPSHPPRGLKSAAQAFLNPFRPSRIRGFVDTVLAGEIVGWALDAARPQRRVHVIARAGATIIAEALADLPRRDLLEIAPGSDGRHGFRLRISAKFPDEVRSRIVVEAVAKPKNVALKRGRLTKPPSSLAPPSMEVLPGKTSSGCGFLEHCVGNELSGWAVDPRDPTRPATVDIFDGELFLGLVTCDRERPSLQGGRAPAGAMGFVFKLPDTVDARIVDRVRGRITGSRLELGRGRHYPGPATRTAISSALEALPVESAPVPSPAPLPIVPARSFPALPEVRSAEVWLLICGPGEIADVQRTQAACEAQIYPDVRVQRWELGGQLPGEVLTGCLVIFLSPGTIPDRELAGLLRKANPGAGGWFWRMPEDGDGPLFPRTLARLGATHRPMALSGWALSLLPDDALLQALSGDLAALARAAESAGLTWSALEGRLSASSGPVQSAPAAPPPRPRRISLAVWSGWGDGRPRALASLLEGCSGADVEVLIPADAASPSLVEGVQKQSEGVTVRLIDTPSLELGCLWRAFTQASTGQVVVLCRGDLLLEQPQGLLDLCAWALEPSIGAITTPVRYGSETLGGLSVEHGPGDIVVRRQRPESGLQVITAAAADFLVCSRAHLAAVEGIDAARLPDSLADLDLGLRLSAIGRPTVLMGDLGAHTAACSEVTPVTAALAAALGPALLTAIVATQRTHA